MMPRLSVKVSDELKTRLIRHIAKRYGSFYGKINEVTVEALEEYLAKREAEEDGDD